MTKEEFFSQMAKVMEKPEAKNAAKEASTPQELIKAAALAGVTLTEKDLQEAAVWKENGEALSDSELDMIAAAGMLDNVWIKLLREWQEEEFRQIDAAYKWAKNRAKK